MIKMKEGKFTACDDKNGQKMRSRRLVEPFSISALQKNTRVYFPQKIDVYKENRVHKSLFRTLYLRGDIPCNQSFVKNTENDDSKKSFIVWKVSNPQDLDYSYYLPIFFEGLCENEFPYNLIARYAIHDLLSAASDKVLPVIPKIIIPLKNALNTKNIDVITAALRIIQHMCVVDSKIAVALVPFYRQVLPTFNLFRDWNVNYLDRIDYRRSGCLGDLIEETLTFLEYHGGPDSYINIKYCIPTYESYVNN